MSRRSAPIFSAVPRGEWTASGMPDVMQGNHTVELVSVHERRFRVNIVRVCPDMSSGCREHAPHLLGSTLGVGFYRDRRQDEVISVNHCLSSAISEYKFPGGRQYAYTSKTGAYLFHVTGHTFRVDPE